MECYSEYKDSGIEWIGEIPAGWGTGRISSLYEQRNEKVSDKDYQPLSVTMKGIVPQLETAAKTQDGDNRKLVKAGDFAINSRSDRRGSCGISPLEGSVSLITNVLAPIDHSNMDDKFYELLYQSEGFSDEYYRWGTGIVDDLWSTNWARMKNILVPMPPFAEQSLIATYLANKTAEIDALVGDQEKSLELLQEYRKAVISEAVTKGLDLNVSMKDSGIEWIGEIPDGWKISSLQKFAYIRARLGWKGLKAEEYVEQGYPMFSAYNIQNSKFVTSPANFISEERYLESPEIMLSEMDVLLVKDGAGVGKCAVIRELSEPSTVNGSIAVITPSKELNGVFLFYFFTSNSFQHYSRMLMGGMGVPHLFQRDIKKMNILLPPPSVQQEITVYLDSKTAEIDSLIADKQQLIDKLKEYRKSLISEAVTGKFKVPGVVEG